MDQASFFVEEKGRSKANSTESSCFFAQFMNGKIVCFVNYNLYADLI